MSVRRVPVTRFNPGVRVQKLKSRQIGSCYGFLLWQIGYFDFHSVSVLFSGQIPISKLYCGWRPAVGLDADPEVYLTPTGGMSDGRLFLLLWQVGKGDFHSVISC